MRTLTPERQALVDNMNAADRKKYNEAISKTARCRILNQLQHGNSNGSPQAVEKQLKSMRAKRDAKRGTPAPPLLINNHGFKLKTDDVKVWLEK